MTLFKARNKFTGIKHFPFLVFSGMVLLFLFSSETFSKNIKDKNIPFIIEFTKKISQDSLEIWNQPLQGSSATPENIYELVYQTSNALSEHHKHSAAIRYITIVKPKLKQILPQGMETEKKLINLSCILIASYAQLNLLEQAINISLSALQIARQNNLKKETAALYNYLGYIYYKEGLYSKADSAYLKSISLNERLKDKKRLFINYSNLSSSLGMQNNYDKAIEYAYLAIHQLGKEEKETAMICLRNVAGIYYLNKDYSVALKTLREVKKYQEKENQIENLIDTYRIMYLVFNKESRPDSAFHYLQKALRIAQTLNRPEDEVILLNAYADFNQLDQNYKKAYDYLLQAVSLQDSLTNERNKKRIDDITQLYKDEQQQHIEDITFQEELLRTISCLKWGIIFLVICTIGITGFFLITLQHNRRNYIRKYRQKTRRKEISLQKMHEQINSLLQRKKEFQEHIALKEKELTSLSLNSMRYEEFISTLREELRSLLQEIQPKNTKQKERFYKIISLLNQQENGGLSEEFKYYFENIHPSFFENLTEAFPSLTPRDLRLCALLRMGLSTKEIADITFRETRSVESARNRLRKKCNLPQQEDLTKFFSKY